MDPGCRSRLQRKENPPIKFRNVFADARGQGYKLTMHCDVDQENSVTHIWQCINEIGVNRIDHGVNALEDDALVEEIRQRNLGLTVCPHLQCLCDGRHESACNQGHALKKPACDH